MNILDINENQSVYVTRNTITVKENDKTKGLIKDITSLRGLQANKLINYSKQVRPIMNASNIGLDKILLIDGALYYFDVQNNNTATVFEKLPEEKEKHDKKINIIKGCDVNIITVRNCNYSNRGL